MPIKQTICTPCFVSPTFSFEQVCRAAVEIGYPAIEIHFPPADFAEQMAIARRHKLTVASMCGHRSITDGLNRRANHDRIERELRHSIDIAADNGIVGLIAFSGNRNPHQCEADAIEATADGLKRIAGYAEEKGVNVNLELLNSKIDHAGYQCDHTSWGVAVVQRVGSPRVKLLYDIYHMQIMEGDVIRNIRENIQWIGHFHTAGNPGRRDLDDDQELNYAGICRAIAATGYELYLGHEYTPKGDPIESLKRAFALCDQG